MVDFTGGTWRSLIDGSEVGAIPDSAVYYWLAESFADPWLDEIVEREMSISGLTATTVDGRDAVAGDGSDYGEANISDFESQLNGPFAVEFALATTDDNMEMFGNRTSDGRFVIGHGDTAFSNGSAGDGTVINISGGGSSHRIQASSQLNDGSLTSVIINIPDISDATQSQILHDDQNVTTNVLVNDNPDTSAVSLAEFLFWGFNNLDNDPTPDLNGDIVGIAVHNDTIAESSLI